MREIIISIDKRDIDSLQVAIELLQKELESQKGMKVYPNKESKALNKLGLLKHRMEKELEEGK